jgi:hypothetical protein
VAAETFAPDAGLSPAIASEMPNPSDMQIAIISSHFESICAPFKATFKTNPLSIEN